MNILDNNLETKLYDRINDDWWHEVIKLYSAQTDASEIIRICLDQDPPSAVALSLAVQCLEEAQQVQPELRIIAEKILFENAEDADLDIRKIIAQALLSSRLKHLSALSPSIFIDTKLVTNAEYQLFVDDMLWRGKGDYYPSHWESKSFPSGSAHEPALGLTPEDSVSFCEWLTELHAGSGEWYFRLPVKEEIITENYLELPGFWMLRDSHNTNPNKHQFVTLWENIQFGLPHVPDKFILKQTEEEIKKILAYLRFGNDIPELNDSLFLELGNVLKKLLASSTNSKELLSKSANELFINIKNTSYSRPVDFGYNLLDTETYDQALSDLIYQFDKDDFEDGIMCSVKCFSNIINSTHRSSNRLKTLFVSFAFVLIIKWIEKNKSLFAKVDTQGTQQKIDYLVDRYIDYLIILGRQNGVVKPFEGLLIVKEIRDRTFDG